MRSPAGPPLERAALAHLLELALGLHLLGEQRGLDAVEQAFEPADELGLRDAQLRLGGRVARERERDLGELGAQVRRRGCPRARSPTARGSRGSRRRPDVVERRAAGFVEERAHHRRDADELRRPGDLLVAVLALRFGRRAGASRTSGINGSVAASAAVRSLRRSTPWLPRVRRSPCYAAVAAHF